MADPWLRRKPLTAKGLARFRRQQVKRGSVVVPLSSLEKFTCDDCGLASKCTLAFDPYNTRGDCLYEK